MNIKLWWQIYRESPENSYYLQLRGGGGNKQNNS